MVSYHDPLLPKLYTPHDSPSLNKLQIGTDLLCNQGFKRALDQNGEEYYSEGDELESTNRTISSSSMDLHSAFDPIWNHKQETINEMDLEASLMHEFETLKSDITKAVIGQSEISCNDYLDIEEIKGLLNDENLGEKLDDSQMKFLSSCEINFGDFLLLENTVPWN